MVELSYFRLCLHEQVDYDRECLKLCKCIGKGRSGQVGRVEESGDRLWEAKVHAVHVLRGGQTCPASPGT